MTLFIVFLLCGIASAEIGGDGLDHTVTKVSSTTSELGIMSVKQVCTDGCCKILWDITHGESGTDGFSQYTDLVADLQASGYTVTTSGAGVDTPGLLPQYSVLVVSAGSSADSAYTPAEVDAIEAFVNNGGGLLVMDEWDEFHADNIEPVVSRFGTYNAGTIEGWIHVTSLDTSHEIFSGVTSIYLPLAGPFRITSPSSAVAWYEDQPVVTVVDGKKIVMIGDGNVFQSQSDFINTDDNRKFAANIFKFLCPGENPIPEFPTVFLPVAFVIGLVGAVLFIRGTREH